MPDAGTMDATKELKPEVPDKDVPLKVWSQLLAAGGNGVTPRGVMAQTLERDGVYLSATKAHDVLRVLAGLGLVECHWIMRAGQPRWPCYSLVPHGLVRLAKKQD